MSSLAISKWTQEHENILKEWKAKAFANLWLQTQSCYYYVHIYNWLAYLVIILSSFASATMFSLNPSPDDNCKSTFGASIDVIQYVVGTVSLLSAILTAIIRQLKPGEMYQQHATTAKRYHNIIRSIDACLSLAVEMRPDSISFIEKVGIELDNLANNQVDAPLRVIKKFEHTYGPLERILYGEDVVELWKIGYNTQKMEKKLKKFAPFTTDYRKRNSISLDGTVLAQQTTTLQSPASAIQRTLDGRFMPLIPPMFQRVSEQKDQRTDQRKEPVSSTTPGFVASLQQSPSMATTTNVRASIDTSGGNDRQSMEEDRSGAHNNQSKISFMLQNINEPFKAATTLMKSKK